MGNHAQDSCVEGAVRPINLSNNATILPGTLLHMATNVIEEGQTSTAAAFRHMLHWQQTLL
jgi:hypothetical protein